MNSKTTIRLAVLTGLAVLVLTGLMLLNGRRHKAEPAPTSPTVDPVATRPATPVATEQIQPQPKPAEVITAAAPRSENVVPETGGPVERVVRVKSDTPLATVNGVAITLKDLLPLPKEPAGTEQMLSAGMYDFLFTRAIERELILQAARAQGLELTQEQKQRLAEMRARSEQRAPKVFDTGGHSPDNVEFEQRDFTGLMLQAALAEHAGVPSPHVTPELVEAYFQQHQIEYPQVASEPAQRSEEAWQQVDAEIRQKLAPGLQAAHDEALRKFVEGIKANANIVVAFKAE